MSIGECCTLTKSNVYPLREVVPPKSITSDQLGGLAVEAEILNNHIKSRKVSTKSLHMQMIGKGKITRYDPNLRQPTPSSIRAGTTFQNVLLREETLVCLDCFHNRLWFQILFDFFQEIKDSLPVSISSKENCWYGVNCKTISKASHANTYNHLCPQTHF